MSPKPTDKAEELGDFAQLLGDYLKALVNNGLKRSEAMALVADYQILYWGNLNATPGNPDDRPESYATTKQ